MHKIWFNGQGYPDAEAMPPDVRRQYEAAMERRARAEDSRASDVVRMGVWEDEGDGNLEVHTSREIIINGKKYSDLEELPSSERELVRKMMSRFPDLLGELPDFIDGFDGEGLGSLREIRTLGISESKEEKEQREAPARRANRTRLSQLETESGLTEYLKNGWAVALVLAMILLWILMFGG